MATRKNTNVIDAPAAGRGFEKRFLIVPTVRRSKLGAASAPPLACQASRLAGGAGWGDGAEIKKKSPG
jgi:hypothetical protein